MTDAASSRWGNSPQEQFVGILNNRAKGREMLGGPARKRGFVVLARNTTSLQVVQTWCLQQAWNDCLAVRYRIQSAPVFGTLFAALSDDSRKMEMAEESSLRPGKVPNGNGSVLFKTDGGWPGRLSKGYLNLDSVFGLHEEKGELQTGPMLNLLDEKLGVGWRLVLLAEVVQPEPPELKESELKEWKAARLKEWEAARSGLFQALPERMGLVLAGAPADFSLPADDHYLPLDLKGLEPPSAVEPPSDSEKSAVYQPAALNSDRPSDDDRLDVQRYADAVARFLLHPRTEPLTVAIHGPWGKGKSSFMQLVQKSLRDVADKPVIVNFNAWRFQDSTQIWAGLASTITSELEEALPRRRRLMTPVADAWRHRPAQLIVELVLPAVAAVLVLVLATLGIPPLRDWLDQQLQSNALARLIGGVVPWVGALAASFWLVWSQARKVLQPVSERVLTYIRRPDYREQMGYQHLVLDDLQFVTRRLRDDEPEPRIFVFIDDLDRCPTEKVVDILQAINLLLGESDFYVILGIHTEMVYRAINAHYAIDGQPPEPRFAETYLQKIVQLPFHLPRTPDDKRASFVAGLFSAKAQADTLKRGDDGPGTSAEAPPLLWDWDLHALGVPDTTPMHVEDTLDELQAFLDLLPFLEDNPREVKRLVNIHRFVKIILQREGRPTSTPDQRKLVKWLIFCDRWPDLVHKVLEHAQDHTSCKNPIGGNPSCEHPFALAAGTEAAELQRFAAGTGSNDVLTDDVLTDDVLTAKDLAPGGPLDHAASISHLVVWRSAAAQQPAS
jgi:hypothetical protein